MVFLFYLDHHDKDVTIEVPSESKEEKPSDIDSKIS